MPWNPFQYLEIEKEVPLPPIAPAACVPWTKMEPGDSVFLKFEDYQVQQKSLRKLASRASRILAPKRFLCWSATHEGLPGVRIWRIDGLKFEQLAIQSDVPPPREKAVPWDEMETGQSVWIAEDELNCSMASMIKQASQNTRRKAPKRFTARRETQPSESEPRPGLRIWRVK